MGGKVNVADFQVKSAQEMCWRHGIPSLDFGDIAENAFKFGPKKTRKLAGFMRYYFLLTLFRMQKLIHTTALNSSRGLIQTLIVIVALGACCVYIVFVSSNISEVCTIINICILKDMLPGQNGKNALYISYKSSKSTP